MAHANPKQAQDLNEAYRNLNFEPLTKDDFQAFFIPTKTTLPDGSTVDVRGGDQIYTRLLRNLKQNPLANLKFLVTGPKGCGKSTELNRLQIELGDSFLTVNFSIREMLNLFNFTSTELIMVVLQRLFEEAANHDLEIDEAFLIPIKTWADSIENTETITGNYGVDTTAGGKAGLGLFGIGKLFASLTTRAKFDKEFKQHIVRSGDLLISRLLENANLFLAEVKSAIEKKGLKGLLIIVEDLDKIEQKQARMLFVDEVDRIKTLNANIVFTYPLTLRYMPGFTNVQAEFAASYEFPLIKTHLKDGSPYQPGCEVLTQIVKARMNPDLFEEGVLQDCIRYSGGHLADLFRLIRDAGDNALDFERSRISAADFEHSKKRSIENYRNMIGDWVEDNQVVMASKDFYAVLEYVGKKPGLTPQNEQYELELRRNHCILFYNNGENWIDLHPLVRELLEKAGRLS